MTPEAGQFLQKAHTLLTEAGTMVHTGLHDAAGRNAYLAAYHAARAFIFERTGQIAKTHNGTQTEFLRLTRNDPRLAPDLRIFLSQAYNLKAIADYETGPGSEVSPERAAAAVEAAGRFVARIVERIEGR
jgi:uncharacterized protein (UPF0332 family)